MASRSRRKQRPAARPGAGSGAVADPGSGPAAPAAAEQSRSERRNSEARARLTPLAPGERPLALKIAVAVALLIAAVNAVALALGLDVAGAERSDVLFQFALSEAVLLLAAAGMWTLRYWAVLGFQALLGIFIVVYSLSLLAANSIGGVLLRVLLVGAAAWLFWHLVRVMGRLQAPRRRPS